MFFSLFLCFTDCLCGCVFFSDILLIYSAVGLPVCLMNLLTYFTLCQTAFYAPVGVQSKSATTSPVDKNSPDAPGGNTEWVDVRCLPLRIVVDVFVSSPSLPRRVRWTRRSSSTTRRWRGRRSATRAKWSVVTEFRPATTSSCRPRSDPTRKATSCSGSSANRRHPPSASATVGVA